MSEVIYKTVSLIQPPDEEAMTQARERQDRLTKPPGSLGRLEEVSIKLAGIQGKPIPHIEHKAVITMAGDHGVVEEKVGNWPQEVTAQMVLNFLGEGAAINALTRQAGARVVVVDIGVATALKPHPNLVSMKVKRGTNNIAQGPAMTQDEAAKAVENGINILNTEADKGLDIVGTGDMGIGNTTPCAAICAVMTGSTIKETTGRGAGISDEQLDHKIEVIKRAIAINRPDPTKPMEVLAKLGGLEIGGLTGVMLAAAARRIPVVIDGFISGAAALIACAISADMKDYLIAAHLSAEGGHRIMLDHMGLKPLLDLQMRLGEGTGAALGIFVAEAAARALSEMATFGEAGVSEEDKA